MLAIPNDYRNIFLNFIKLQCIMCKNMFIFHMGFPTKVKGETNNQSAQYRTPFQNGRNLRSACTGDTGLPYRCREHRGTPWIPQSVIPRVLLPLMESSWEDALFLKPDLQRNVCVLGREMPICIRSTAEQLLPNRIVPLKHLVWDRHVVLAP